MRQLSICCVLLAFIPVAITTSTPPNAAIVYDSVRQLILVDVNVTYIRSPNAQYMYDLNFSPWVPCSSVYLPPTCGSRQTSEFNITAPLPWSLLFQQDPLNNATNVLNGKYTAWPTPTPYWTMSVPASSQGLLDTVAYHGTFTLDKIAGCGGTGSIRTMETADSITYLGTLYVTLVKPALAPSPANQPLTAKYSVDISAFPFSIVVSRLTSAIGSNNNFMNNNDPTQSLGAILAILLSVEVVPSSSSNNLNMLAVSILTRTPASLNGLNVVNYNDLQLINVSPLNGTAVALTLDSTNTNNVTWPTSTVCSLDLLNYCQQTWTFFSAPIATANFNGSYAFNFIVQQCNISDTASCTPTAGTCSIVLDVGSQTHLTQVNVATPFSSTLTPYTDSSFLVVRTNNIYLPGESVYELQKANLGAIDPNFYQLSLYNLWLCTPLLVPPFLGFDVRYGVQRQGCSTTETLNGDVNIPASNIVQVVDRGTAVTSIVVNMTLGITKFAQSVVTFTLGSDGIRSLLSMPAVVYIHAESLLTPSPSGSSPLTRRFHLYSTGIAVPLIGSSDGYSMTVLQALNFSSTPQVTSSSSSAWTPIDGLFIGGGVLLALVATWAIYAKCCRGKQTTAAASRNDPNKASKQQRKKKKVGRVKKAETLDAENVQVDQVND